MRASTVINMESAVCECTVNVCVCVCDACAHVRLCVCVGVSVCVHARVLRRGYAIFALFMINMVACATEDE